MKSLRILVTVFFCAIFCYSCADKSIEELDFFLYIPESMLSKYGKITSSGHWIPEYANEANIAEIGPFIRLSNSNIFTISGNSAKISNDEGKTWDSYPIFPLNNNYSITSPRFIEVLDGTIVLGFMNMKEQIWNWDYNIHDAIGAQRPIYAIRSLDGGKTWQDLQKLQNEYAGFVNGMIITKGGTIILSSQILKHNPGRNAIVTYSSKDNGVTWKQGNILDEGGSGDHAGLMEATIIQMDDNRIWILARTNWGYFYESFSSDEGITWSDPVPSKIDASSAPGALIRLKSGHLALVWNRFYFTGQKDYPIMGGDKNFTEIASSWQREELSFMLSDDDGKSWTNPVIIMKQNDNAYQTIYEPSKSDLWVAYPTLFEAYPGEIWLTTTHFNKGKIKFNESDILKIQ